MTAWKSNWFQKLLAGAFPDWLSSSSVFVLVSYQTQCMAIWSIFILQIFLSAKSFMRIFLSVYFDCKVLMIVFATILGGMFSAWNCHPDLRNCLLCNGNFIFIILKSFGFSFSSTWYILMLNALFFMKIYRKTFIRLVQIYWAMFFHIQMIGDCRRLCRSEQTNPEEIDLNQC